MRVQGFIFLRQIFQPLFRFIQHVFGERLGFFHHVFRFLTRLVKHGVGFEFGFFQEQLRRFLRVFHHAVARAFGGLQGLKKGVFHLAQLGHFPHGIFQPLPQSLPFFHYAFPLLRQGLQKCRDLVFIVAAQHFFKGFLPDFYGRDFHIFLYKFLIGVFIEAIKLQKISKEIQSAFFRTPVRNQPLSIIYLGLFAGAFYFYIITWLFVFKIIGFVEVVTKRQKEQFG